MVVIGNFRNRPELRKKKRRHFHYNARAVGENGTMLRCSLVDISEIGARIVFENDSPVPDEFVLLLTASGETRRHCKVIWRNGTSVGVAFPEFDR